MGKASKILRRQRQTQGGVTHRGIPELRAELARSEEARKDAERMVAAIAIAHGGQLTIPRRVVVELPKHPRMTRWEDPQTQDIHIKVIPSLIKP